MSGADSIVADLSVRKDAIKGDHSFKVGLIEQTRKFENGMTGDEGQVVEREFRRFAKIGTSMFSWNLGLVNNVDAVIFEARKPVRIFGIGIYGPFFGV